MDTHFEAGAALDQLPRAFALCVRFRDEPGIKRVG